MAQIPVRSIAVEQTDVTGQVTFQGHGYWAQIAAMASNPSPDGYTVDACTFDDGRIDVAFTFDGGDISHNLIDAAYADVVRGSLPALFKEQ